MLGSILLMELFLYDWVRGSVYWVCVEFLDGIWVLGKTIVCLGLFYVL